MGSETPYHFKEKISLNDLTVKIINTFSPLQTMEEGMIMKVQYTE